MKACLSLWVTLTAVACGADPTPVPRNAEDATARIREANDSIVSGMVAGTSTASYRTSEWRGVNLNGTPMTAQGFEGGERRMEYDSIQVLDRDVRLYGETAALSWHANFFVKVNGEPSFAEMRLLDVYVRRDGRWLLDQTQVTPVFGTVGNPPGGPESDEAEPPH